MDLDIKKAFHSPFSEEKWHFKLIFPIVMAFFQFIPNSSLHVPKDIVLLSSLISLLPGFVLSGFMLKFENNEIHDQVPLLPVLTSNIKKYFIFGLKALGIAIIYGLTAMLIGFFIGFVSGLLNINKLILISVLFIYLIFFIIVLGLAQSSFADNFSFKTALSVKRVFRLMSNVKFEILRYLLTGIGLILATAIISAILFWIPLKIILVPIALGLMQLILVNLKAQLYKVAKQRLEGELSL